MWSQRVGHDWATNTFTSLSGTSLADPVVKIPHASWPKNKTWNRSNIVTNSIKALKNKNIMLYIQVIFFVNKTLKTFRHTAFYRYFSRDFVMFLKFKFNGELSTFVLRFDPGGWWDGGLKGVQVWRESRWDFCDKIAQYDHELFWCQPVFFLLYYKPTCYSKMPYFFIG